MFGRLLALVTQPLTETLRGLERCLVGGWPAFGRVFLGLAVGWWLYVPVHELLHALACLATGGTVTRLEIAPLYGGALWAEVFPFVVPASDYAGRLSGFDTHGSDLRYLATDFGPYLLTVFPGVWWLRRAARRARAFSFGAAVPVALAPLVGLPGDAYEIGSILTTRMPGWSGAAWRELLRGDDVFLRAPLVFEAGGRAVAGFGVAVVLGVLWALATYHLGGWFAARGGEPRLAANSLPAFRTAERKSGT